MSPIPIELVESILDYAQDDVTTLKSCSLVTRAWLSSLRHRLFHTKSFDAQSDYDGFITIVELSPGIAGCVRHLRLTAPPRVTSSWATQEQAQTYEYVTNMARLCPQLPNVDVLHLTNFTFHHIPSEKLADLLTSFGCIMGTATKLSFDNVSFARADEIRRFIAAFSGITDLSLERSSDAHYTSVLRNSPYDVLPVPQGDGPLLRSLRMLRCSGDVVRPVLQACTLQLRHLGYWSCIGYDINALREAVTACESLDLAYCGSDAATKQGVFILHPMWNV